MKPLLLAAVLMLCSVFCKAQFQVPYSTGFDDPNEQTGWTPYMLATVAMPFAYSPFCGLSAPNCLIHAFPPGNTQPIDDWFVSPAFDFSNGARIDSLYNVFSGPGMPGPGDTLAVYLLTGNQSPPMAQQVLLHDYRDATYTNDGSWHSISGIIIPPTAGLCYIGIRYSTMTTWMDVSFDNLKLSAITGIADHDVDGVDVFPNPVMSDLKIFVSNENLKYEKLTIKIYNATGALVEERNINAKDAVTIERSGSYFYVITNTADEIMKSGKFIKY